MSGRDIEIVLTRLRVGEKLHKDGIGIGTGESDERPIHPMISHAKVSPLSPVELAIDGWLEWVPSTSQQR